MKYENISLSVADWIATLETPRPGDIERAKIIDPSKTPSDMDPDEDAVREFKAISSRESNAFLKQNLAELLEELKKNPGIPRQFRIKRGVHQEAHLQEVDEKITTEMETLYADGIRRNNLLVVAGGICALSFNRSNAAELRQSQNRDVIPYTFNLPPKTPEEIQDEKFQRAASVFGRELGFKKEFKWDFFQSSRRISWNTILGTYALRCVLPRMDLTGLISA